MATANPVVLNLNPKITKAGVGISPSPQTPGLHVELTHVALGTARYAPVGTEVALRAEVARFAITSGTSPAPGVIQIGCTISDLDPFGKSPNGKAIGEIGFYAGNTLWAVWSQEAEALFVKSPAFDVPMAYVMDVSVLPAGAVTVTVDPSKQGLEALILAHEAKADPHSQYLTAGRGDSRYTPLAHAGAADPHTQYLTAGRGDTRYTPLAHAGAADPHTQYLNKSRADAGYVKQGSGAGQYNNALHMGWDGSGVRIQVDGNDGFGRIAFQSWVNQVIANVVGAAPQTLDQISELAAAIGNDPNFVVTMANQLAGKERKFDAGVRFACANWTAPVGWTTVSDDSTDNRMMRVVASNGSGAGGVHNPIYNNLVPAHTHSFQTGWESNDHAHFVHDPGHSHGGGFMVGNLSQYLSGSSYVEEGRGAPEYPRQWMEAATTGIYLGGTTTNHTHGGFTDNGSSQTNWEPRYLNLIIVQKN